MWDYLIVTASNEAQAQGYRVQLEIRQNLGLLTEVKNVLVVPDPQGKRVGSGGSTLFSLLNVLEHQQINNPLCPENIREILEKLRILIIHAGGDSKRLPAYGPCGKIFVPVPGRSDRSLPLTLFDRQLPTYLDLPAPPQGTGQVLITSGDVMLCFDPRQVSFDRPGLTGLGCYAPPERAANHGVYCGVDENERVRLFLQKPSPDIQQSLGAIDIYGRSVLDIGVINFDAATAIRLLELFGLTNESGRKSWQLTGEMGRAVMQNGLDFYREICCALGREVTPEHHIKTVRSSGSKWDNSMLKIIFHGLAGIDFNLQLLLHCDFIDFGTTAQIITSGTALMQRDSIATGQNICLDINNEVKEPGQLTGIQSWVESCRINSPLKLTSNNVITGVDIDRPLTLPPKACLDVIPACDPDEKNSQIWFVRCYGVEDTFKSADLENNTFCNMPVNNWLKSLNAGPGDLWHNSITKQDRTLWNAKLFPAVGQPDRYRDWLWMFDPETASNQQREKWKKTRRYSPEEIAGFTDQENFFKRRLNIYSLRIKNELHQIFRPESEFSADELAFVIEQSENNAAWLSSLIEMARWHYEETPGGQSLTFSRIIHTLASVIEKIAGSSEKKIFTVFPALVEKLPPVDIHWLNTAGLAINESVTIDQWSNKARALAFETLGKAILLSASNKADCPRTSLRSDEIVWGRAPARFDTGGGWTDTPPYSLEYGGSVINAAVNLNGQAPIQAYLRVIDRPVIKIGSIDLGTTVTISDFNEMLDYRSPHSQYGLVKAALALAGFSNKNTSLPSKTAFKDMLESFGGGIEITTLAAIPKGSGLGTSSIMGAVILAVIYRAMGKTLTQNELFNKVLHLEQALTTGGGWQDQVGGVTGAVKIIHTDPGLVPNPKIHYLPEDILEPSANGGVTLLYYTGITRLAKNILEQVVGRYLDRNRRTMATLRKIHALTAEVSDALSRKDLPRFGELVDAAWRLNKELDPNSSNDQLEKLFKRVENHIYGAKLLGAGGGGFMLMVCKSPKDAQQVREKLHAEPPNERSRFFDYNINHNGLVVTVC